MSKTRYYSKKLSATTTEQSEDVRGLVFVKLLNYGNDDILVEFDNVINDDSIIIPTRGEIEIPATLVSLHYKALKTISIIYLYGVKNIKS